MKNILSFIFTTKIGWTLIAFLTIFPLVYFKAPQWCFLFPIGWIAFVFVIGCIGAINSFAAKEIRKIKRMERLFTIKKGNHYANRRFPFFYLWFSTKINFTFKFETIPTYTIGNKQKDTNKIFGISDNTHHHKDSIRIGFRYVPIRDNIELICYHYTGGKNIESLGFIDVANKSEINKSINGTIEITKNHYNVTVRQKTIVIFRKTNYPLWFPRYLLFPYFGGDKVAPKEFKIKLKWGYKSSYN